MPPARPGQVRRVVPYGFDPGQMTWSERARAKKAELLARSAGRPVVFVVGRHVYYKGLDVLLRAMADIDALLIIGGTGPLTARPEAASRAHPDCAIASCSQATSRTTT